MLYHINRKYNINFINKPDIFTTALDKNKKSYYKKKMNFLSSYLNFQEKKEEFKKIDENVIIESIKLTKNIIFEITENCNLNCKYCSFGKYYHNDSNRKRKNLNLKYAYNVLDYFFSLHKEVPYTLLISFYGGEPLLKIDIIKKIVNYAKTKWPKQSFRFNMTTNGVLIKKHIDYLVNENFYLLISIDGNKRNNEFRIFKNNKESYSIVHSNIKYILDKYPKYYESNVNLNSVLHSKNYKVQKTISFLEESLHKTPEAKALKTSNVIEKYQAEFNNTFTSKFKPSATSNNEVNKLINNYYDDFFDFYFRSNTKKKENIYFPNETCLPFQLKTYVNPKGYLFPCEKVPFQYALGHVDNNQVNINYKEVANIYNSYIKKSIDLCSKCYVKNCMICLFDTEIPTEKPKCKYYIDENKIRNQLTDFINQKESVFENKNHILYFEPYVKIETYKEEVLFYNTLNGFVLTEKKRSIINLFLDIKDNQFIIINNNHLLNNNNLLLFVEKIKKHFLGDLINNRTIPYFHKSILSINKERFFIINNENKRIIDLDYLNSQLREINLYINSKSSNNRNVYVDAYKQYPMNKINNSNKYIDINDITKLFETMYTYSDFKINIYGGNVLLHNDIESIFTYFSTFDSKVSYHFISSDFEEYVSIFSENELYLKLSHISKWNTQIKIFIDFPINQSIIDKIKKYFNGYNVSYCFIIQSIPDIQVAEKLINEKSISKFEFIPIDNGKNKNFIKNTVLLSKNDIRKLHVDEEEYLARKEMNTSFFGKLYIKENCEVYSNLNNSNLGNLKNEIIADFIYKELESGKSWNLTRGKRVSCKKCVYCSICPPVTNLELATGLNTICKEK